MALKKIQAKAISLQSQPEHSPVTKLLETRDKAVYASTRPTDLPSIPSAERDVILSSTPLWSLHQLQDTPVCFELLDSGAERARSSALLTQTRP